MDRGVRTVQRWEKEFNLPVRRLGTGRGEGVFAFAHELDAWQTTAVADRARQASPAADSDTAPADTAPRGLPASNESAPVTHRLWQIAVLVLSAVVVLLGVFAAWTTWRGARQTPPGAGAATAEPAIIAVDLDTLVVSDAQRRVLWRHRFPAALESGYYAPGESQYGALAGIADIDGDGRREVWIVPISASGHGSVARALHLFEGNGSLRWTYGFAGEATFGRTRYPPFWYMTRVFITENPAGGPGHALWVSSQDPTLFPAVLQRIDPKSGKSLSSYWSNGYITSVALARVEGRHVLLVGACNNETKGSSLAVLDALNPNGVAPAEKDDYRCTSCEGQAPETFVVFPKPRRFGALDMAGAVFSIAATGHGITLVANHGQSQARLLANGVYTLDTSFRPTAVAVADQYAAAFKAMVDEGAVPAGAPAQIDAEREFVPLKRWDASQQRYVPLPLVPTSR